MALIDCPSCSKKMSDKAPECKHCGFNLAAASDEDISRKTRLKKYNKVQSIQTQSMLAMLMFVTGFGFMFWGETQPGELQYTIAMIAATLGFFWYIANRIRMIFVKKSD